MLPPTLYILTGSTAVGKTELALEWAECNNAEIISCDSLLVYQGMDIGTAKPTSAELVRVPHHLINIVPASKQYTVKKYIDAAIEVVNGIALRGKKILIVGGSGFYLKSFLAPLLDSIEIPKTVKSQVNHLYEQKGLMKLVSHLLELNPQGVGTLDLNNPRRVTKAVERCIATGRTLIELKKECNDLQSPFHNCLKSVTLLQRDSEDLQNRIRERVRAMFQVGLIKEVQHLLQENILANPSAASAIGYKEIIEWLQSGQNNSITALQEKVIQSTLKFVAKQRKWFRHQIQLDKVINLSKTKVEPMDLFPA